MGRGEIKERMALLAKEAERRKRYVRLRKDTLRKVDFLRKKSVIESKEVYRVVKEFFKEFLEQPYEFTAGELQKELKNVYISSETRKNIAEIMNEIQQMEYQTTTYSHAELHSLLDQFSEIVHQLVRLHTRKKTFWAKVRGFIFQEEADPEVIIAELPAVEHDDSYHVRVHTLVEKCYISLDQHKLGKAKAAYQALLDEYATLPEHIREEHYPLLDQTYQDIVNRVEMLK